MAPSPDGTVPWAVWRVALVVSGGAFLSTLDAAVVGVGLEALGRELGAGLGRAQWVATGYLLAFAAVLPAGGWLMRRAGTERLWLGGMAAFLAASAGCALAGGVEWLIALRVLQGVAGGLVLPAGQAVIGRLVGPLRLGRVLGTTGIVVTLGPALGPVAGGLLIDTAGWRWMFLINLPVGLPLLGAAWRLLPRAPGDRVAAGALDVPGLSLLAIGLPLVVYGGTGAPLPLAAGLAALTAFGWLAMRGRRPILDLTIYTNRRYAAATVTVAFSGAALFGGQVVLPLYLQLGRGVSAAEAGLLLVPAGLGTVAGLPVAGRLVDRHGAGVVAAAGAVLTAVPTAGLALDLPWPLVQALLVARGAGMALVMMPGTTGAFTAVTAAQLPDATTQISIVSRVAGAAATAGLVIAFGHGTGTAFALLAAASLGCGPAAVLLAIEERRR
ncbi:MULTISPECIES: MFS transporter [Catenuloplanes]|uniref:EmrB/QacA subfamily drug resistance transporter n=1 Tax=Catenuloplanes niger TaxID=587534 RepID=A0AAE3ZSL2_9ACTN|nr:MFS transporter [Catenuloplanes niger]MDR7325308.1 EmrB/QacA subfamily drug resistance transporter [Catenuloplanes niger]